MSKSKTPIFRIDEISIENYKGIDKLKLEFPEPRMPDDIDVFIMGSENGLGKTSILECCFLLLAAKDRNDESDLLRRYADIKIPEILIRGNAKRAKISGKMTFNNKKVESEVIINSTGEVKFSTSNKSSSERRGFRDFVDVICGLNPNPIISNNSLFFHGYRKIQEGNIDSGMMVENNSLEERRLRPFHYRNRGTSISTFKLQVLRSLMASLKHFEGIDREKYDSDEIMNKLDFFLSEYANSSLGSFGIDEDNKIYFKIKSLKDGNSFALDGLSSGQKEIISTSFLIWLNAQNNPCVVLIDEPELHLNSQWHRKFIRNITKLAPNNQYIIATHSEYIMSSVDKDRRVLLVENN